MRFKVLDPRLTTCNKNKRLECVVARPYAEKTLESSMAYVVARMTLDIWVFRSEVRMSISESLGEWV